MPTRSDAAGKSLVEALSEQGGDGGLALVGRGPLEEPHDADDSAANVVVAVVHGTEPLGEFLDTARVRIMQESVGELAVPQFGGRVHEEVVA